MLLKLLDWYCHFQWVSTDSWIWKHYSDLVWKDFQKRSKHYEPDRNTQ